MPIIQSRRNWFQGTKSLAIPESDHDWLSGLNCFIRETCVEAFSATKDDTESISKRGRITLHQVGIRCCFCSHRPTDERQVAAISYPVSVAGIYESVKRIQKVHLTVCEDVPQSVKDKLEQLGSANAWIPTTRQYWADSARSIGMVDTPDGIRFASYPNADDLRFHQHLQASPDTSKREPPQEPDDKLDGRGQQSRRTCLKTVTTLYTQKT